MRTKKVFNNLHSLFSSFFLGVKKFFSGLREESLEISSLDAPTIYDDEDEWFESLETYLFDHYDKDMNEVKK